MTRTSLRQSQHDSRLRLASMFGVHEQRLEIWSLSPLRIGVTSLACCCGAGVECDVAGASITADHGSSINSVGIRAGLQIPDRVECTKAHFLLRSKTTIARVLRSLLRCSNALLDHEAMVTIDNHGLRGHVGAIHPPMRSWNSLRHLSLDAMRDPTGCSARSKEKPACDRQKFSW